MFQQTTAPTLPAVAAHISPPPAPNNHIELARLTFMASFQNTFGALRLARRGIEKPRLISRSSTTCLFTVFPSRQNSPHL